MRDVLLPEAREEYANVLEDTRHPANKEAFRPEDLRRARDEAKMEVDRWVVVVAAAVVVIVVAVVIVVIVVGGGDGDVGVFDGQVDMRSCCCCCCCWLLMAPLLSLMKNTGITLCF